MSCILNKLLFSIAKEFIKPVLMGLVVDYSSVYKLGSVKDPHALGYWLYIVL